MEWKRGYDPGTGGGQRGGGGGAPRVTQVPGQAQADQIWAAIQARLNAPSRYTPEVMSALVGSVKDRAERGAALQMEENRGELARRGILRSTIAADDARDIRGKVYSTVLAEQNRVNMAKVEADYADKTAAIQEGLAWLNSLRSYVAQSAATAASREVGLANIALGEQRLRQEMDVLRESYQQRVQFCILFPATCGEDL